MRILVTGGMGEVGRPTVQWLLTHGHSVRVLDLACDKPIDGAECFQGSITDFDKLRPLMGGVDSVVHLAAYRHPALAPEHRLFDVNVGGTFNVFRAAADAGIKRVVCASSINALGYNFGIKRFRLQYFPMDEAHPSFTTDPYSFSKQIMEEIGAYFWRREGISSVLLRLPGVYEITEDNADRIKGWRTRTIKMYAELLAEPEDEQRRIAQEIVEQHTKLCAERAFEPRETRLNFREIPHAGMMFGYSNFWASIDARDSAQAIELGLLADYEGSHPLWVNDSCNSAGVPTQKLVELFYPDVPLKRELTGTESLVSIDKAGELLGFEPEYSVSRWF